MQGRKLEMESDGPGESAGSVACSSEPRRRRRVFLDGSGNRVKQCRTCDEVLPVDAFTMHYGKPAAQCKSCRSVTRDRAKERVGQMKKYYADHEVNVLKQREYQKAHRDKYRSASRKWRLANPDKMATSKKNWETRNKDRMAAARARRYAGQRQRTPKWLTDEHYE